MKIKSLANNSHDNKKGESRGNGVVLWKIVAVLRIRGTLSFASHTERKVAERSSVTPGAFWLDRVISSSQEIRLDLGINSTGYHDRVTKEVEASNNTMGDQTGVEQHDKKLEKEAPFPLTDVDKWILSQNDEDFHLHSWDELREIIGG
jgi:hypothetical protein